MRYSLKEHEAKKHVPKELKETLGVITGISESAKLKLTESFKEHDRKRKDDDHHHDDDDNHPHYGGRRRKLIVQMEAIHVGRTANYTFYTDEGLKEGLSSWTQPYSKPVLTHHDSYHGEPIGRILKTEFAEATRSGRKGLIFTCEITDPDAIEKVLDGRYHTVSIGATTDKVTCNICGTDRTEEWCEHWRGEDYDGQTCHYIVGTTFGKEVSYVNVPADEYAGNFSITVDDGDEGKTNESATLQIFQIGEGVMQSIHLPEVNLYESASDDVKQLVDGLMNLKEGSAPEVKFKLDENGNQILDEHGKPIPVEEGNPTPNVNESELQTQLTEAQNEVKELKTQLTEAQGALSNMVIEKSKVDSRLTEMQQENDRLVQENSDLTAKAHKVLAEKVVDIKLSLRKSDVVGVSYEEAVQEHIKRTEESLTDLVKDLQLEMQNTSAARGSVTNPGAAGDDNNPNTTTEGDEKVTVEDALGMFKGMFGPKRKR